MSAPNSPQQQELSRRIKSDPLFRQQLEIGVEMLPQLLRDCSNNFDGYLLQRIRQIEATRGPVVLEGLMIALQNVAASGTQL